MQLLDDDGSRIQYDKNTVNKVADNLVFSQQELESGLPDYGDNWLEWTLNARPVIDGRENILKYLPYYLRIYEDEHPSIQYLFARQCLKTTTFASRIGFLAATKPGSHTNYTTYEDESLSTFANLKLRQGMWSDPRLSMFVKGSTIGEVGRIMYETGAKSTHVTHAHDWKHLEGKSVDEEIDDEAQYLAWNSYAKAKETQAFTQGKQKIGGIGGYVDSDYQKMWLATDQREWIFNNELWRDGLEFNQDGLVYGDYMLDLFAGHWKQMAPENHFKHGYHISQTMVPWIPLTKQDAIEKYKTSPEYSLEYKRQNYPQDYYRMHVLAEFIKGDVKPITKEMMYALLDRNLDFTPADKIDKSLGKIYYGADWGGGTKTVRWCMQCIDPNGPVFRLLFAATAGTDDVNEQFEIVKNDIESYDVDQAIVDAGGGTHQMQELMKYFGERCRKFFYLKRPEKPLPDEDEKKRYSKENKWQEDKTFSLDSTVDLIKRPHTYGAITTPRIIIPASDMSKIDWIIDQFTNEEVELINLKSTGQPYRRYYTPDQKLKPDDALQACNDARIAWWIDTHENQNTWWFSA